ncbi:MAG: glycosyltransferase family 4 protein [bacterium]
MRICLVSSSYRPYISGVGEHVHYLGKELKKLGHQVHVLTTTHQPVVQTQTLPSSRLGKAWIIRFARGEFILPVGLTLACQVKDFFSSNRFDIVHCHGIFPPEIAYWSTLYSPAPVVVTFHAVNPQLPGFVCTAFRAFFVNLRQKVNARIAVSRASRDWAEHFFPGQYNIIPNGIDLNYFHPDVKPNLPVSQNHRLLFVGRLEKRKGLEYLFQAMPKVLESFPDTQVVVVGFGPLKYHYQQLAARLGIKKSVQFVGPVANHELAGYYTSATLCIAPATGREAMGIVLIEAMACGLPVIASRITGYDEVIEDGVTGILVTPKNVPELAAEIIQLLKSPMLRNRIAQQARIRARDYDWGKIAGAIEKVYLEVK